MASEFVWGVDPALSRLAFAFADVDSDKVEVETLLTRTDAREGERLGLLDRQIRIYARQVADRYPPAAVFVEQPSGRFRAPQLVYCVGVEPTTRCGTPSREWGLGRRRGISGSPLDLGVTHW